MTTPKQKKTIEVDAGAIKGTHYAQVALVTVSKHDGGSDTTFDFAYVHPQKTDSAQVVARVTMPTSVAKRLATTIQSTIGKNEKRDK